MESGGLIAAPELSGESLISAWSYEDVCTDHEVIGRSGRLCADRLRRFVLGAGIVHEV
jgi:hypothetical protein